MLSFCLADELIFHENFTREFLVILDEPKQRILQSLILLRDGVNQYLYGLRRLPHKLSIDRSKWLYLHLQLLDSQLKVIVFDSKMAILDPIGLFARIVPFQNILHDIVL